MTHTITINNIHSRSHRNPKSSMVKSTLDVGLKRTQHTSVHVFKRSMPTEKGLLVFNHSLVFFYSSFVKYRSFHCNFIEAKMQLDFRTKYASKFCQQTNPNHVTYFSLDNSTNTTHLWSCLFRFRLWLRRGRFLLSKKRLLYH